MIMMVLCILGGGGARSCQVGTARFAVGCMSARTLVRAVLAAFVLLVKRTNTEYITYSAAKKLVADVCVATEKNLATDD